MEQVGLLILVCIVVGVVCLLFYSVIGMFVWESLRPLLGWREKVQRGVRERPGRCWLEYSGLSPYRLWLCYSSLVSLEKCGD
uniref:Uncharacterized protein n=1 Tax=Pseudomonas phage JS TaxID=3015289 RepID=A0AAT9TRW2_9VIRU